MPFPTSARWLLRPGALWRGQRRWIAVTVAGTLVQLGCALGAARLLHRLFDVVLPARDPGQLAWHAAGVLGLGGLALAADFASRLASARAAAHAATGLRRILTEKIYALPRTYHDARERLQLHDLLVRDVERTNELLATVIGRLLPAGVVALALFAVLWWRHPWLTLGAVLVGVPTYALLRLMQNRLKADSARTRRAFGRYNRGLIRALRTLNLAHTHGAEAAELNHQARRAENLRQSGLRARSSLTLHFQLQQASILLAGILVLVVGGQAVLHGYLTLGELVAFFATAAWLGSRLRDIASANAVLSSHHKSIDALHAFWLEPVHPPYQGTDRIAFTGRIELRQVSFAYATPGHERAILDDVSLQLQPGRITALLGPNGAGKSTLLHLILGLYRPDAGSLQADGRPYDELDLVHLRRHIGTLPQQTQLVPGTIFDNIAYGLEPPDPAAVESAARLAAAHEFILALPAGYATRLGNEGALLSGGQRQRLALARALARSPRLLILDEPTSHLDPATVSHLIASLRALQPPPAILLVTHDAQLAAQADETFSLEGGRLTAWRG